MNEPEELSVAIDIAVQAGRQTLGWFRSSKLDVRIKDDGSPVTSADYEAEEVARKLLHDTFPDDDIVGEESWEFHDLYSDTGHVWTIDPIDGTRSFVSGVPTYSTLLARGNWETKTWDLGVIYIPALDELVYAHRDFGCWYGSGTDKKSNPRKVHVSDTSRLEDAKVVASGADYVTAETIQTAETFRTWGDGYGYLLLATGQVDLMLDIDMSIWDIAPMYSIVSEAGGEILSWKEPYPLGEDSPTQMASEEDSFKQMKGYSVAATNSSITADIKNRKLISKQ